MAGACRIALIVVALTARAWADNSPPAAMPKPHENKVSPEAKAAIENFEKLVYRPAEHGLSSASAVLAWPDGAPPAGTFRFVPPARLAFVPGAEPVPVTSPVAALQFRLPLRAAFEGMPLIEEVEHDAEMVEKGGAKWLVVTSLVAGAKDRTDEFTFDAAGLLAKARPGLSLPGGLPQPEISFTWGDVGGLHRVEAMELTMGDASHAISLKLRLAYSDVAGVNLLTSFTTDMRAIDGGKEFDKFAAIRLDSLVVNGRSADVPNPGVHKNRVAPDAEAAMNAYARLVYRPTDHGLLTMTGTIVPTWTKTSPPTKFDFRAPNLIALTSLGNVKADSPGADADDALRRFALVTALDGVRMRETSEFDAALVVREGARTLEVVEYRGDARTATVDFAIDARGLVASVRRRAGSDPSAPESDLTVVFTWGKTGDLYRVESADLVAGPPGTTKFGHYAFAFATIEGVGVPVAYTRTVVEPGRDAKVFPYRIEDLVVNGKKIDLPKPDGDPTPTPDGWKK